MGNIRTIENRAKEREERDNGGKKIHRLGKHVESRKREREKKRERERN